MENRFDRVRRDLPGTLPDKIQQWIKRVEDLTDGQAKQTGAVVLENLQNDEQFEDEPYREFIEDLATLMPTGSCVSDYNTTCRKFHRRGPEASVPKELPFHRLVKKRTLARRIAIPAGWSELEAEELYDNFVDSAQTDEAMRKSFLSKARIGDPRADMLWGGFDLGLTDADSLAGLSASEAKAVLGLGEDWYPPGETVVHLKYLPPETTVRYIPTVADAEWNPYWMPAPAGTGFGLTRHLGKPLNTPGRGEVVHDNGTLDWLVSPLLPEPVPED